VLEQTGTPGDFRWEDMMQVTVQRVVNYNGEEVIAELSIYYPR
jgi:hypothetical protein